MVTDERDTSHIEIIEIHDYYPPGVSNPQYCSADEIVHDLSLEGPI
jgi:hypothetical protein